MILHGLLQDTKVGLYAVYMYNDCFFKVCIGHNHVFFFYTKLELTNNRDAFYESSCGLYNLSSLLKSEKRYVEKKVLKKIDSELNLDIFP